MIQLRRFALAVLVVVACVAPARAVERADLVGTWELKDSPAAPTLVFDEDGSGSMVGTRVLWSVAGDKLSIQVEGETHVYGVALAGDKLTLSGGDLEAPTTFTRKGAPAKKSSGLGGKLKGAEKKDDRKDPLVGTWRAEDGSWFRIEGDGTVTIANNKLPVTTTADKITIAVKDQKVEWPYVLEGDVLTTTVAGKKLVWKRAPELAKRDATAAPADAKPAGLTGQWKKADGTFLDFRADGSVQLNGIPLGAYRAENGKIKIADDEWSYRIEGDKLLVTDDEGMTETYQRVGAPPQPPQPPKPGPKPEPGKDEKVEYGKGGNPIGAWDSDKGITILREDGTATYNGEEFSWSVEGTTLKLVQGEKWITVPFTATADKLILGSGPAVTLTRAGIAGVWVGEEATLDPSNYLSYTQYVILYKDGSVGYAKSEGYASRRMVTENLERFWSGGEKTAVKSVGTWQKDDAGNVSIQFNGRAGPNRGRVDTKKMTMVLQGMGVLNEGAALEFKKK